MTSRLYIQKRGPSGGADIDHTAFTGRKGASFFDGNDSLIEMGNRYEMGEASQGEFVLGDPEAEMPRADYEYEISPHVLVTWTEDATGNELWLARTRIVGYDGGRGVAKIDNETEFHVTVEDCNVELRGQAFTEAWIRPEESDIQRIVALQLYTLNGASSTAPHFRETCEVTVNTTHLAPNANTVTMPAKKYLAGTQPQEVIQDCAQMAGKMYGVVIHHVGGSHLCLLYTTNADHTTYLSPCKISDDLADWDPLDPSAPVFEPNWQRGAATTTDFQTNLSGFVTLWGSGENSAFVEYPTNVESYDYWVEPYNDSVSTSASQSANRAAGMLEERRQPRLTHRPSVIVQADQTDLLAAGMSIQVKFAVALGGIFLDTWQTRRIVELRWEPRHDGTYWAHMEIDRPVLRVAPGRGRVGPFPPVQGEPSTTTFDARWNFNTGTDDGSFYDQPDDDALGYYWRAKWSSGGYAYTGSLNPSMGTESATSGTDVPVTAGVDYTITGRICQNVDRYPSISMEAAFFDVGEVNLSGWQTVGSGSGQFGAWFDVVNTFTAPVSSHHIHVRVAYSLSRCAHIYISHGETQGIEGTPPPPASTDQTGTIGDSPYYSPADHQHPAQDANVTTIQDAGEYFTGDTVETALQELGEAVAGVAAGSGSLHGTFLATYHDDADENMHLMVSADGITFTTLVDDLLASSHIVRDPSIIHFDGAFWIVATYPGSTNFRIYKTTDLTVTPWTEVVTYTDAGNTNTWAPEWVRNLDGTPYIHPSTGFPTITFARSTDSGSTFVIREVHPTDRSMSTLSTAVTITGSGLPSKMIDPFLITDGTTFYLWYKQETNKYLEYATSSALTSGYTVTESGDWANWNANKDAGANSIEGPCVIRLDDGRWRMYFNENNGFNSIRTVYSDSTDLTGSGPGGAWGAWTEQEPIVTDVLMGHGSVVFIPGVYDHSRADDPHPGADYLNETEHDALDHDGIPGVGADLIVKDIDGTPSVNPTEEIHFPNGAVTAAGGGVAEIGAWTRQLTISDTPSTPLVFADILQNEAEDDLIYDDSPAY